MKGAARDLQKAIVEAWSARDRAARANAFRAGRLSGAPAREIAGASAEVPEAENQLLEAAGKAEPRPAGGMSAP